jgi:hypothetical protein
MIDAMKTFIRFLYVLYKIYLAILGVAVLAGIYELITYLTMTKRYVRNMDLLPSEMITGTVDVLRFIFMWILFINFLRWIYGMNRMLVARHREPRFSAVMSVGSFFIPVLNLFRPFQVLADLRDLSGSRGQTRVGLWWILWIISHIIGRFVIKYTMTSFDLRYHAAGTAIYLVSNAVDIALYLIEFDMVKRISKGLGGPAT